MLRVLLFLLLYLTLPFNAAVDLVAVLVFMIAFRADATFAVIYAFLAGLLLDLYHPVTFGLNALVYTIGAQLIIVTRRYLARDYLISLLLFCVFYLFKTTAVHLFARPALPLATGIATIIAAIPCLAALSRVGRDIWTRA